MHGAGSDHFDLTRGGEGEIDDPSIDEGAAIVDSHGHTLSVLKIADFHPGVEGKRAMRGGQFVHVEDLAVGRAASIVRNAVPTCDSSFSPSGVNWIWRGHFRRSSPRASRRERERRSKYRRTRVKRPLQH